MVNPPRLVSVLKLALKTMLLVGLKLAHFCSRLTQLGPQLTHGAAQQPAETARQSAGTVRHTYGTAPQPAVPVRQPSETARQQVVEFAQAHLHHCLAQLFGKSFLQSR